MFTRSSGSLPFADTNPEIRRADIVVIQIPPHALGSGLRLFLGRRHPTRYDMHQSSHQGTSTEGFNFRIASTASGPSIGRMAGISERRRIKSYCRRK